MIQVHALISPETGLRYNSLQRRAVLRSDCAPFVSFILLLSSVVITQSLCAGGAEEDNHAKIYSQLIIACGVLMPSHKHRNPTNNSLELTQYGSYGNKNRGCQKSVSGCGHGLYRKDIERLQVQTLLSC